MRALTPQQKTKLEGLRRAAKKMGASLRVREDRWYEITTKEGDKIKMSDLSSVGDELQNLSGQKICPQCGGRYFEMVYRRGPQCFCGWPVFKLPEADMWKRMRERERK